MKTKSLAILENAQLPSAQARAILEVMEAEFSTDALATKADLQGFAAATKADLERFATKAELQAFAAATKAELQGLGGKLEAALEIKSAQTGAAISAVEIRVTPWVVATFLGQAVVILGALYFAVTHLRQ